MQPITVIKRDPSGVETWRYDGELVARGETWLCLVARFNRDDHDAGYVVYRRGDVFTEYFYADRWFNVFRIADRDTGALKGWYCNITRPAELGEATVAADDLALDVFVTPDREVLLLDEDEFAALELTAAEQGHARAAVETIRGMVARREEAFGV